MHMQGNRRGKTLAGASFQRQAPRSGRPRKYLDGQGPPGQPEFRSVHAEGL